MFVMINLLFQFVGKYKNGFEVANSPLDVFLKAIKG